MKARAPFQPAPTAMPIAAISSSAWTKAKCLLAGLGIDAIAARDALERLGKRGRGRDRIPCADRGAAVDRAQARGVIAFDENSVADRVAAFVTRIPSGQSKRLSRPENRCRARVDSASISLSLPLNAR